MATNENKSADGTPKKNTRRRRNHSSNTYKKKQEIAYVKEYDTTPSKSVEEIKKQFSKSKENFANADNAFRTYRDLTKNSTRSVQVVDKQALKSAFQNVGSNEKTLRNMSIYLYYRSNLYYRLINWYSSMFDLRCRKVTPEYNLTKDPDPKKMLKSYNDTLDALDILNLQGNFKEISDETFIQDVYYGLKFSDDVGTVFYELDPDDCIIDGRYSTGDFSFAMDMSKWKNAQRQQVIEFLGSPLKEMYAEYERTGIKYVHCVDEYCACFKFRTNKWDVVTPPFLSLFLSLASLEGQKDLQADADQLELYKLIYLPMKTHSHSNDVDDFEISPELSHKYFKRMLDNEAIPANVAAAIIPGEELKTIDFSRTVDSDVNSVEKAQNQILGISGGGAVINSNKISTNAAFLAWLKAETEYALSSLIPQINGACNRWLSYMISKPCKVDHFEVSVYTKDTLREEMLKSCQHSFSNRLAYNTLLGISEKETLAMEYFETQVLKLPELMNHPLTSSYTSSYRDGSGSGIGGQSGAPEKSADQLSDEGDRSRNRS